MRPRNVLVIGGNGYLGSHTAAAFQALGDTVAVLDLPGSRRATILPGAPEGRVCEGSVTDLATVREATHDSDADIIVLLASYGEAGMGLKKSAERNPGAAVDVNVHGLLNVLNVAAERPATKVVWLSSTTVYGESADYGAHMVTEEDLIAPRSVYAATKVLGEQLIRTFRSARQLQAVAIRPTLVWGPGITYVGVQSGLNTMVEAAASGHATNVAASDELWDLIYVRDVADATAWLSRRESLDPVVLVNGYRASIRDVQAAVLAAEPSARISVTADPPHRMGYPLVDDGRIRREGFAPRFDLAASIADYLAFEKGRQARESNAER